MKQFGNVAILGAGLLGSSVAAALKSKGLCKFVGVWSRSESTRKKCESLPFFDKVFDTPQDAARNADLIIISTNARSISETARLISPVVKEGALITDVGSTKRNIAFECDNIFHQSGAFFVASHPMCGSEKSGPENADAKMFEGATCFVCMASEDFGAGTSYAQAHLKIEEMWTALGMKSVCISPSAHDKLVARISHLPQCAASALASTVLLNCGGTNFFGKGFKDTTRIAKSDANMWIDILVDNADNVEAALRKYIKSLESLAEIISKKDEGALRNFLETAQTLRKNIEQ